MHRRSSDDLEWKRVKQKVDERDKRICRCCAILTPFESEMTKKLNPPSWMMQQIDHAHVKPVGGELTEAYNEDNVYCMCRWHHSHIDNLINPLTNDMMSKNEQWYWWVRVRFKKTDPYDESKDYEALYDDLDEKKEDHKEKSVMDWW